MVMSVNTRVSFREDDPVLKELRRLMMTGERPSTAIKRIATRYSALMAHASASPGDIVRDLSEVIVSTRIDLIGRVNYPSREEVLEAVDTSAVSESTRKKLRIYLERLSFTEYAKLIEAVELMYRA